MEKRCYGCMRVKTQSPLCEHCGYNENIDNLPHQLPLGTVLQNRYEIGKVLGQGGFGITYLGWDRRTEQAVAIKEYYPNALVTRECSISREVSSSGKSADGQFQKNRERFLREAKTLSKLDNIPGVVRIYGQFEENNTAYFAMEYLQGMDLRRYVQLVGGRLGVEQTLKLLRPIMEALEKVHESELVHRDISPDNIMLLPDGTTKLLDFGAVKEVVDSDAGKELSQSTEAILKHGFAPLEQYQKKGSLGPWTDVYAMCATIYYCLTGQVPPEAHDRLLEGLEVSWRSIPGLTTEQQEALEQGMRLIPKERTASIAALSRVLYGQQAEWNVPVTPGYVKTEKQVKQEQVKPEKPAELINTKPIPKKKEDEMGRGKSKKGILIAAVLIAIIGVSATVIGLIKDYSRKENIFEQDPVVVAPTTGKIVVADPTGDTIEEIVPEHQANVLMENPISFSGNGTRNFPNIGRADIITVTFLDTTNAAPDDSKDVSQGRDRSVLAWVTKNGVGYDLYFAAEGKVKSGKSCSGLFEYYSNLEKVSFNNCFDTKEVTDMSRMFANCASLVSVDMNSINTENVTNMSGMFSGCDSIQTIVWNEADTSRVTDMGSMFIDCQKLKSFDISIFDTSNVTNMQYMFFGCDTLNLVGCNAVDITNVEKYEHFLPDGKDVNGRPWKELFQ